MNTKCTFSLLKYNFLLLLQLLLLFLRTRFVFDPMHYFLFFNHGHSFFFFLSLIPMYCPVIYQPESCVLWETHSHQMVYLWTTQHINHKKKSINLSTKWPWIEDCVVFWSTDQPFENCPVGKSYMFSFLRIDSYINNASFNPSCTVKGLAGR